MSFHCPDKYRVPLYGSMGNATNGAFKIPLKSGKTANVIASDGAGWEHVSVSLHNRCPTWGEMCQIKALFWDDEDCVVQFHPPKSQYVNFHPYCLHLWRQIGVDTPVPDSLLIGPKAIAA